MEFGVGSMHKTDNLLAVEIKDDVSTFYRVLLVWNTFFELHDLFGIHPCLGREERDLRHTVNDGTGPEELSLFEFPMVWVAR